MKKIFGKAAALASAFLMSAALAGCAEGKLTSAPDKTDIICATFSEYDWTRNIVGDREDVNITYLLDNGVDLHNYQPSVADVMKISDCDMFVYVGGESDKWVTDVLRDARNKDMKVVKLLDALGDSAREEAEGENIMQGEEEEEDGEEETEYDEHIWLSVRNAEICSESICETLCDLDSANAGSYRENLRNYMEKLDALDSKFADMTENAKEKTIVVADRFPFLYLAEDYGISYFAAFAGCSAEAEASFSTIVGLADKLDELNLGTVFIIENSSDALAKSIIENSKNLNRNIETLNSIQSVTAADVESGVTYLTIMEQNLETLRKVLD